MHARIFNIQKFSLHDGPGIRSVVFFKGCPLHCPWCSNPESQSSKIQVLWDAKTCTRCLTCVHKNKAQNITFETNRIAVKEYDPSEDYETLCPTHSLQVEGEDMAIEDIVAEVIKDLPFYEESGGGVTLSGGETLQQADAAIELMKQLKAYHIHCAAETTGYSSLATFKRFIEPLDVLLYDMKHYDASKHKEACGVSNEVIIRNMKYALQKGKAIIARIPVIPGFNDSLEDAKNFSILLKEIGIKEVNLLPFHQFGLIKYEQLGIDYKLKDTKQLYPEDLKAYQDVMIQEGLHCYF